MLIIKYFGRLIAFFATAGLFLSSLAIINFLNLIGFKAARRFAVSATRFFSKLILKIFNIEVRSNITAPSKPVLYVCNHMSYLDAVAVFSEVKAIFITSTEMRDKIGLGHLCKMANCLFVNRARIWDLPNEIAAIKQRLNDGFSVVLFPEGTTSSGHYLKEFKSSLVQAAVDANVDVVPLSLNFAKFCERKPLLEDRDYYCWYGTMDFLPHLFRLCSIKSVQLDLTQLPTLSSNNRKLCRKTLTRKSKKTINDNFIPIEITS